MNTLEAIRDEYTSLIKENITKETRLWQKDELHFRMESDYAIGEINFYELDMVVVAELIVNERSSGDNRFYLHFELRDLKCAMELFNEMLDCFLSLKEKSRVRILLCCTSALTTTYFANKLNETAKLLSLEYEFCATAYDSLYKNASDYNAILIAPQAAYHFKEVSDICFDKTVLLVPPRIFATYDALAMLDFLGGKL